MRTARSWSLGKLAQQAGISKAALSQWETGTRQPRVVELEAVLNALGASAVQRALVFARIEAPRALRHLRQKAAPPGLGAPPTMGDLLRALRLRQGWTQARLALHLGVDDSSIARWERGERLPSSEQVQALCYALEAKEPEVIALTTGRFSETPQPEPRTWEEKEADLYARLDCIHAGRCEGMEDLGYLTLERAVWAWAAQHSRARKALAHIYAQHATFVRNEERWTEAEPLAQRALVLLRDQSQGVDYVRAGLMLAAAAVHGGYRRAPERGLRLLKPYLDFWSPPEYRAWILADLAEYAALAGQMEAGLSLAQEAHRVAQRCDSTVEPFLRRIDYGRLLVEAGRPVEALGVLPQPGVSYPRDIGRVMLLLAEAHGQLGHLSEAHDWLEKAQNLITAHGLVRLRAKADALTRRF
jgi:transcriptional regulator with XRE-family HTH domain